MTPSEAISLVAAGGTIVGAGIAWLALRSWRHQMTTQRLLSFAEEALTAAYLVRDALSHARQKLSIDGDGKGRPWRASLENEEEMARRDSMFAAAARLERLSDHAKALRRTRHHADALIGPDSAKPFDELLAVWAQVITDSCLLVQYDIEGWGGKNDKVGKEKELRATVFADSRGRDEISKRIDEAVAGVERLCRPMLERLLKKERKEALKRLGKGATP